MEFSYGMEFLEEFLPHATEYYLGFMTDSEEYMNYYKENNRKESI